MDVDYIFDTYKTEVTEAIIELNECFLRDWQKIADKIIETTGEEIGGTIAYVSLTMLSANLLYKYRIAKGSKEGNHLFKRFCTQTEKFYNEAIKSHKDLAKEAHAAPDYPFQ